jgi:hypothetical protein
VVLRLASVYTGGNYYLFGYIVGEHSGVSSPAGFATAALGAYIPQAGRCGIIVNSDQIGTGLGVCDYLLNEFT